VSKEVVVTMTVVVVMVVVVVVMTMVVVVTVVAIMTVVVTMTVAALRLQFLQFPSLPQRRAVGVWGEGTGGHLEGASSLSAVSRASGMFTYKAREWRSRTFLRGEFPMFSFRDSSLQRKYESDVLCFLQIVLEVCLCIGVGLSVHCVGNDTSSIKYSIGS
jgi:hypothetical protein